MPPTVKTKKRCCKDRPRCKRCPAVWKRLEREDLAERLTKRTWQPAPQLKKKHVKAARG